MAVWGSIWGSPWGVLAGPTPEAFCQLAESRALGQMGEDPGERNLRDVLCALGFDAGHFVDVAQAVAEGLTIATAVGRQLDRIGSAVSLPRSGLGDDFYRLLLTIQAGILKGQVTGDWTGTINDLLRLIRLFIGPTISPIVYEPAVPYGFKLTIPKSLTAGEIKVLFRFIRISLYAGVLGSVQFVPEGANLYQSNGGGVLLGAVYANAGGLQNPGITPGLYSYTITT